MMSKITLKLPTLSKTSANHHNYKTISFPKVRSTWSDLLNKSLLDRYSP